MGLSCDSNTPDILSTRPEVNDLEGFFCVLNFKGHTQKMPKGSLIQVYAYAPKDVNKPAEMNGALYKEKVLEFEVTYISKIKIESYYRNGVALSGGHRTESIKVYSNTPFQVLAENQNEMDKGYDLLKFKINKTTEESPEYLLTVTVPQEITHDFVSHLILVHPTTGAKTIVPIHFNGKDTTYRAPRPTTEGGEEGILSGLANLFSAGSAPSAAKPATYPMSEKSSFFNYILLPFVVAIISLYCCVNMLQIGPSVSRYLLVKYL